MIHADPISIPTGAGLPEYDVTLADAAARFGPMPLRRIRSDPAPGAATEEDLVRINEGGERLCELIDGTLLEKTVGNYESWLAGQVFELLSLFVKRHRLGVVLLPDGMYRLRPGLVRLPDVSFVSWDRLPGGTIPDEPVWSVVPDLAVEVISRGNTREEMDRKLRDYFEAGVRLVWYVLPHTHQVRVYTAVDQWCDRGKGETLQGDPVLPGLTIDIDELFARPIAP